MVIIEKDDPRENVTFFHIPKNAGSSIEHWLVNYADGDDYHDDLRHANPISAMNMFPQGFGWKFCVIRNPWARHVSWWKHFAGQNKIAVPFNDYMDHLVDDGWDSRAKYMRPPSGQLPTLKWCHFAIDFDRLETGFAVVQEKLGVYEPLGWRNKGPFEGDYVDYFTKQKHIDYVAHVNREEIEGLGFAFGKPRDYSIDTLPVDVMAPDGVPDDWKERQGYW